MERRLADADDRRARKGACGIEPRIVEGRDDMTGDALVLAVPDRFEEAGQRQRRFRRALDRGGRLRPGEGEDFRARAREGCLLYTSDAADEL